jgi:hypothetical protein
MENYQLFKEESYMLGFDADENFLVCNLRDFPECRHLCRTVPVPIYTSDTRTILRLSQIHENKKQRLRGKLKACFGSGFSLSSKSAPICLRSCGKSTNFKLPAYSFLIFANFYLLFSMYPGCTGI